MIFRNGMLLGLTTSLVLGATAASAEELVRYDFDAGSPVATTTGDMTGTDAVFGPFTFGSSTPSIDGLGTYAQASATNTPNPGTDALADAIAGGDYVGFTIDSTSASPYSISDISFNYTVLNGGGYSLSSHLLTSATGFAASDSLATTNFFDSSGTVNVAVDVSGNAALQGLTGPVEVRIYFSDSTFNNAPAHRVDEIIIEGVPEPGSLALLGVAGACLFWHRRRP